jgi:hypothetical protein
MSTCPAICTFQKWGDLSCDDSTLLDGQDPDYLPDLINTLFIQADSGQAQLVLIPLIGVTIDVTLRLRKSAEPPVRINNETKVRLILENFPGC